MGMSNNLQQQQQYQQIGQNLMNANNLQSNQYQQVGQNLMNPNAMQQQQYQQVGQQLQNQNANTLTPEMWNEYLTYANQVSQIFREPGSNLSHIIQLSIPMFQLAENKGVL